MADPKFPYVRWRDGRPRAVHGPVQRKRGFVDKDLRHPDGSWFTMEEAAAFSDKRVSEVKKSRGQSKAMARARAAAAGRRMRDTVVDLLDDWMASDAFRGLSKATKQSYVKGVNALLWKPETREQAAARRRAIRAGLPVKRQREGVADMPVLAVGKPEYRALHEYLVRARGVHMARATIATLSAAMTWATESTRWRLPRNPRLEMSFEAPGGRVVLVTIEEFQALVAAADAMGRPSIGDAMYLGLFTGQRQTDRLNMRNASTVEGRHAFRQSKTKQLVDIKEAPQLTARLIQARARVAAIKLRLGLKDMPPQIVINEENGQPYASKTYGNWFAKVRDLAIAGSAELGLAPCPSLAFVNEAGDQDYKHDQDLRDTCVMLLDRAGCDLLTICDITGHSYASAQTIVKHYRARNAARADTGIDRLELQVRKEGMAG